MTGCVICATPDEGLAGWTDWTLPADIHWRSAFTRDSEEPPQLAGAYRACPPCTAWIPKHRAGAMPARAQQGIHAAVTAVPLHPATRQQLHAELVGRMRHLAGQLQPRTEKE